MNSLFAIKKKIKRSLAKRGVLGTFRMALIESVQAVKALSLSRRRASLLSKNRHLEFDKKYNVDTCGIVSQSELSVSSENQLYAVRYEPIYEVDFCEMLEEFGLDYSATTFVDIGSGKGKAVLLAAAIPFKKIIGVEFSEELNSIAKSNINKYSGEVNCGDIEIVAADAAYYSFSTEDPLVIFLYNPFEEGVMQRVANNLARSFSELPRRIVILYFSPYHSAVLKNLPFLTIVKEFPKYYIFDTKRELYGADRAPFHEFA